MSKNQSQFASKFAPELEDALRACRVHFIFAVMYSIIVNILFLVYPIFTLQVFDRVVSSRSMDTLVVLFSGFILAMGCKVLFMWLQSLLLARAAARVDRRLSDRVCGALIDRSGTQHRETGTQALADLENVRFYLCGPGLQSKMDLPWAGLYIGVLMAADMVIGVVALSCLVGIALMTIANTAISKKALEQANKESNRSQRFIEANLRSSEAILPMGMLPGLLARWQASRRLVIGAQLSAATRSSFMSAVMSSGQIGAQGILLCTGVVRVIEANIPLGIAFMSTLIFGAAAKPAMSLVSGWEGRLRARQSLERLNALLRETQPSEQQGMTLPRPNGEITFAAVHYFIKGNSKPLLRNINLKYDAGKAHGVIGPSGSGKSTIIRLVVGNLHPTMGNVRLDGAEIRNWDRSELGRYLGYLPQEVCLAAGTVADNIGRFGMFDETDIVAAAKLAGAHELILRLPLGYDTPVGEGGVNISGGQRQMIGLARAVVGNPSVVVLDEANSNLDGPGEVRLMACVAALRERGTTVLMVTHRPNLLRDFDTITHVRDGSIVASGPAAEIMQRMRPGSHISIVPRDSVDQVPAKEGA